MQMLTGAPGESGGFHIKAGSAFSYPAPLAHKHGSSGMENREKVYTHTHSLSAVGSASVL